VKNCAQGTKPPHWGRCVLSEHRCSESSATGSGPFYPSYYNVILRGTVGTTATSTVGSGVLNVDRVVPPRDIRYLHASGSFSLNLDLVDSEDDARTEIRFSHARFLSKRINRLLLPRGSSRIRRCCFQDFCPVHFADRAQTPCFTVGSRNF